MQVHLRLGSPSASLSRYARSIEKDFRERWVPSQVGELEKALREACVVVGGDFHAYAQAQRAHVRILRDLVGARPVVLVLECLAPQHESVAADFLSGRISESKFLTKVDWVKSWGFPWEHYRPLFELARDRGFVLRGLNNTSQGDLKKRDAWAARRLIDLQREFPDSLVYSVIGEWHAARAHLPKRLGLSLKDKRSVVVIFQDAENLYFKLALKQMESQVEWLKASHNRFCFMVSPPWVKWQSYLMYLEQAYDRDLQEDLTMDYTDQVLSLVELLESDLKIQTKKSRIQVYCPNSHRSLTRLRMSLPRHLAKALAYHLEHDLSFFLPEKDWLYLSRSTINHAAALAGQFVHAHLCRRKSNLWNVPKDFLPLIWVEAVAFFFSKWINPKRKADSLESIRLQLQARSPNDRGRAALLLSLDHRLSEVLWVQTGRMRNRRFKVRQKEAYIEGARIVGSMPGERLFQKVRSGTIPLPKLMSYLKIKLEGENFAKFYWQLIRELEIDQSI